MNSFLIKDSVSKFEYFNFIYNNKPVKDGPVCGMTLKKAGSMRFRWNETNELRDTVLKSITDDICKKRNVQNKIQIVPVELIHSHIVYDVQSAGDTLKKCGDGIISTTPNLMNVVTVADCMPIYLYDVKKHVYGIVHSGWKGTGIAVDAINLFQTKYASKIEDICVILGPHINDCCYVVNEERANYFSDNFSKDCISLIKPEERSSLSIDWDNGSGNLYRLSLLKANLSSLEKKGICSENINYSSDCTCCNNVFGSNRRETSQSKNFTVQAAFIALVD